MDSMLKEHICLGIEYSTHLEMLVVTILFVYIYINVQIYIHIVSTGGRYILRGGYLDTNPGTERECSYSGTY